MRDDDRIVHAANYLDGATGEAFDEFEFTTIDGSRHRHQAPRSTLSDTKKLYDGLLGKNADLPTGTRDDIALRRVIEEEPLCYFEYAAQTGWQGNHEAYATTRDVYDSRERRRQLLPPRNASVLPAADGERDVTRWCKEVAGPCMFSTLATMTLAAGFAAPLLSLTRRPLFGINIFDQRSKVGKSTMLLASASLFGASQESDLMNWASTAAAMGEACRLHNDAVMPINEAGLVSGPRKKTYEVLRPAIYQLTEGKEFLRHSQSSYSTHPSLAKYRLIFISTAEHPIAHYAALAGEEQDEGELSRCIDIPALRPNRDSIMDLLPRDLSEEERVQLSRRKLGDIRNGCARNGSATPILTLVERIARDPRGAARYTRRVSEQFARNVDDLVRDEVDRHRAMCFGIIVAGGCMASKFNLLPTTEDRINRTARYYFGRAQSVRADRAAALAEARGIVMSRLKALPKADDVCVVNDYCEGYTRRSGGEIEHVIREAAFRTWFDDHASLQAVMLWLKRSALMIPVRGRGDEPTAAPSFSHTLKWPSGRIVRSFVIRDHDRGH